MFSRFKKIFLSKWVFSKPQKKRLLIYDLPNLFEKFIDKDQYEVLDVRYQSINIYILLTTLIKNGLKNIVDNYKKNYLIAVSPNVVLTSIDNNISFFRLKSFYKKANYICVQISLRDNNFIKQCEAYYKNNFDKLYSDFFFVYGDNDSEVLKKYIKSKYIKAGSFKNNLCINKRNNFKKINKIIFISQATRNYTLNREKKIFNKIIKLSKESKLPLFYLLKLDEKNSFTEKIKAYYKKQNLDKSFEFIDRKIDIYSYLNSDAVFLTFFSTLGFETISRKKRVFFLSIKNFPFDNYIKKYPKDGPFWTVNHSYSNIKKIFLKIIKLNNKSWSKLVENRVSGIINYKPKNLYLMQLLKKNKIYTLN